VKACVLGLKPGKKEISKRKYTFCKLFIVNFSFSDRIQIRIEIFTPDPFSSYFGEIEKLILIVKSLFQSNRLPFQMAQVEDGRRDFPPYKDS
jgi:hypothetical protein